MINLKNVSFAYGEKKEYTLNNINLNVKPGEVVLLCGPSGCGKSTLLQLINGIIPELKEGNLSGKVEVDSSENASVVEKSKIIASVFQNPKSQFFHLNTTDELFFTSANHLVPLAVMEKRLEEVVKQFDIEHLVNRNIFRLSGGEKQLIACASGAMNDPKIYVLDEPSSNLDEDSIEKLKNILAYLKSEGKTIIIAEHRLYYALELADRVLYMKEGEIAGEYSRDEFLALEDQRIDMGLRSFTHTKIKNISISCVAKDYLKIENLEVKYKDKLVSKFDSLEIPLNKIVAIVGKNGKGKTSFVKAFTALLKTKNALINGKDLNKKYQQKNSFMVMQDVNNQLYCESVIDELVHLTDESDEILTAARKVLKDLNLLEFETEHPMVLSGGQKQRLAIATALFLNKKYLIFDEPTSGLDYDNMIRVSNILKDLRSKVDCILVITHDSELIENCADHIIRF